MNEFCLEPFVFPVSSVHNNDNNKCSSDVDPLPGFNKNEAAILFKKLAQSYQEISNLKSCLTDVTSEKNVFYEQLIETKSNLITLNAKHDDLFLQFSNVLSQLQTSKTKTQNLKKTIRRRDEQISSLSDTNDNLQKELADVLNTSEIVDIENDSLNKRLDDVSKLLDKSLKDTSRNQKMKWYYKQLAKTKNDKFDILESSYETRIVELKDQLKLLEFEKNEIEEKLETFLSDHKIQTFQNGRYIDDVRACYQDLVLMGVGTNNVERVVRTVLKNFTKLDVESLPKATFSRLMFLEARRISQIHVAECLTDNFDSARNTLHTDGTSKFGKHYGTYDIVTDEGNVFLAGIREVAGGDTETQLQVLKDLLNEIDDSSKINDASNKIVTSIKI